MMVKDYFDYVMTNVTIVLFINSSSNHICKNCSNDWRFFYMIAECGFPNLKLTSGCCLWVILMQVFAALLGISIICLCFLSTVINDVQP